MNRVRGGVESAWSNALVDWGDCTRFIYGFEVGTEKGECGDFDTKYNGVESKGSLKCRRRRRARARDVGPSTRVSDECVE